MPIRPPMTELEYFADLLEVVPDAVFIVAEDGRIAAVNSQAETLTGYRRGELIGQPVEMLVPAHLVAAHPAHRSDYFAASGRRPMGTGLDTRVLSREGVEIPVDIALSPVTADGNRYAVASVRDITERRRLRAEAEAALQRLALVDERERIGRELHDGAIQAIFAIGMSLEGLAARTSDAHAAERLRGVVAQLDGVIRDLRNYIYGLRPGLVARQHLEQALRQLVDEFASSSGVTAVADIEPETAEALASKSGDVVLLAGEALSNVGRHAHALTCRLTLRREGATAILEVEDDGHGFDPSAPPGQGQGLSNLRQRAEGLGGSWELESRPGEARR